MQSVLVLDVVKCDCSPERWRYVLEVGETTYDRACVAGHGGLFERGDHRALERFVEATARRSGSIGIYTRYSATDEERIEVPASAVRVVASYRPERS